jgi:oligopeptide transport system substrate-binding protein
MQSHIVLERNEHYWDAANVTHRRGLVLPDREPVDGAAALPRRCAGHYTYDLPFRQLAWIRANLPDELQIHEYLGIYYFGLNVTQPPFKDNPELRRALNLAIDRDIVTSQVTTAGEIPAYGWVPAAANYTSTCRSGPAGPRRSASPRPVACTRPPATRADRPLRLQILYNTHENHRTIAVAISSMWNEVLGIETELVNEEWKVYLETRRTKQTTQVFRAGWIGDYNDAFTFAEMMHSQSALNDSGWNNPRYDELLALAAQERDMARRAELLHEAERILIDDVPLIPIYFYVTKRLVKPWVGNYRPHIQDIVYSKDLKILKH